MTEHTPPVVLAVDLGTSGMKAALITVPARFSDGSRSR